MPIEGGTPRIRVLAEGGGADGSGLSDRPIDRVRYAVCAIGYIRVSTEEHKKDPLKDVFKILGSGFLVRDRFILTCAHVIHDVLGELRKKRLPQDRQRIMFVYPGAEAFRVQTAVRSLMGAIVLDEDDIAIARFDPLDLPIQPVQVSVKRLKVGDALAFCGYAHGSTLLKSGTRIIRLGPVYQQTCVSALSPYDGIQINEILLGSATASGMSGSPFFVPDTGEVIGILHSGHVGKEATRSFAVPLDNRVIDQMVTEYWAARPGRDGEVV